MTFREAILVNLATSLQFLLGEEVKYSWLLFLVLTHCDGYFWSKYSLFFFCTLNEIILTQGCGENGWKRWVAFVRGTTLGSIQGCSEVLSGDYLSKQDFFRMNFVCQKIETVSVSFPILKHDFLGSTWSSSTGGGSRWSQQDSNFDDRGKYENIGGYAGWFWKYDKLI